MIPFVIFAWQAINTSQNIEKVNKIAIETSKELVKELIDAEVNNSNISAIVEDLSKRNKDKYYDV